MISVFVLLLYLRKSFVHFAIVNQQKTDVPFGWMSVTTGVFDGLSLGTLSQTRCAWQQGDETTREVTRKNVFFC
jgi:hypothetical protein